MGTTVFYVDESGSTDAHSLPLVNGRTPLFTLASVALGLERKKRKELIEVKGNELCAPRNARSSRRHQFLRQVFRLLSLWNAQLFCVTFIKSATRPVSARSLYTGGFQVLLERFNHCVASRGSHDSGIMICDSRAGAIKGKGLDKEVAVSLQSYVFGNPLGKTLTCMHESPLFADSQITVGIQLADIVAACVYSNRYHYYSRSLPGAMDYSHMTRYWPLLDSLQYKFTSVDRSQNVYGFRVIHHDRQCL